MFQTVFVSTLLGFAFLVPSEAFHVTGKPKHNLHQIQSEHDKSSFLSSPNTSLSVGFSDVALKDEKELLKRRLPPVNHERMSKFEIEFRELLEGILYTETEIEAVANPRLRSILEGISASYYEPAVYRAFEVLYEDYMPLRIAGRIVYRRLRDVMNESTEYKWDQVKAVMDATELSLAEVEACWSTFVRLGGSKRLDMSQLKTYIGKSTLSYLSADTMESALEKLFGNVEDEDSMSFSELMLGLMRHGNFTFLNDHDQRKTSNFLQQVLDSDCVRLAEHSASSSRRDDNREQYNQRYDDMLEQFHKWKAYIPDGEGRRLDILQGCFVGSENAAVVKALRIIYVDYSALRLSGDWIFKVVSTIMSSVERRRHSL